MKKRDKVPVKAPIPNALYQAIVRIQANDATTFEKAALKAASFIEVNSQAFKDAVRSEASHLARSHYMKQLNRTRQIIRCRAFNEGAEYVRLHEDNFRTPCSRCSKPMYHSSRKSNWDQKKAPLYNAFSDWYHASCLEREAQSSQKVK